MSTPTRCETFEELMTPRKVMVGECNEDRISSLLDDVLCHILSFLPTKYSVRTSVLSTRWKQLYTFVPNLDFEYSPGAATSYNINFVHFVNSVFSSYNVSRMNKFSFTLWNEGPRPKYLPLFSWLSSALHRQVKEIEISFLLSQVPMALPLDLFSCKTLSMLTLEGHFYVVLPRSVSLPCLRICILLHVYFDDDSARRLFRSCLALEQLTLVCCHIKEGVKVFDISVPSLKRLIIHESGDNYQLVLNVPNLLFFEYVGPAANKFWGLGSLKSLVVARIFCEPDLSTRNDVVAKLVCSISHVQQLYLDRDVIEAFICSRHLLPRFNDLTRMEFSPISCFASRLLPDLLDNTPRLEFLEFEGFGEYEDDADKNSYVLPKHVPICVSLHLKEVEFKNFTGLDYDCKLIKYFLKYAKNLKVMKIQTELIWDEQFEISSAACQIVFYSDDLD